MGELAERLQLRYHSAAGLVDRLVFDKLVSRAPFDADRRQIFIQVTHRGEKMLKKLSTMHRKQLQQLGPELGRMLEQINASED